MKRTCLAVALSAALVHQVVAAAPRASADKVPADKPKAAEKSPADKDQEIANHLQDISVTIVSKSNAGSGEGSGIIKTRKTSGGEYINFVWTAAHVIENLRHVRTVIDSKSGSPKTIVEFDDAMVVKALVEDGRMVGKIEFYAEVVRYSAEEDLALLRLRKKDFIRCDTKFFLEEKGGKPVIPPVGTKLLHVGSLLGQLGSNSMTEGIMSQHGRLISKKVFDQTTVTAFPGSSGGGVYTRDGRCVGLVLRGAGETFNLIAPVRRIHEWAKKANIEWAIDDNAKMPSDADLLKLPVEDSGVSFGYTARVGKVKLTLGHGSPYLGDHDADFPTYLRWVGK